VLPGLPSNEKNSCDHHNSYNKGPSLALFSFTESPSNSLPTIKFPKNYITSYHRNLPKIANAIFVHQRALGVKGSFDGLEPYKTHWNINQSSTRICMEYAFGILKGKWRIIQKWADVSLRSVADIVLTCIVLHNLCIITKDKFDSIWIEEAEAKLRKRVNDGTMKGGQVLQGEQTSIDEVKTWILKFDVRRTIQNYEIEEADVEVEAFKIKQEEKDEDLVRKATMAHESMPKHCGNTIYQKSLLFNFQNQVVIVML
jgi:hypothetical protein